MITPGLYTSHKACHVVFQQRGSETVETYEVDAGCALSPGIYNRALYVNARTRARKRKRERERERERENRQVYQVVTSCMCRTCMRDRENPSLLRPLVSLIDEQLGLRASLPCTTLEPAAI